jgi:hypothetical protein
MKNFAKKFTLPGVMLFLVLFLSCVKEGPMGPQGARGTSGQDGVVNVDAYQFTVNLSDFLLSSSNYEYYIHQNVSLANIQPADAVLVYYDRETYQSNDYWAQLPFNDYYDTFDNYNHFSYELGYDGYMFINIRNSQGAAPYSPMSGNLYFKIVVIKGNTNKKATIPSNLNTNNYEELKQYFKIHEQILLADTRQ